MNSVVNKPSSQETRGNFRNQFIIHFKFDLDFGFTGPVRYFGYPPEIAQIEETTRLAKLQDQETREHNRLAGDMD